MNILDIFYSDHPLRQHESRLNLVDERDEIKEDMDVQHKRQVHSQFDDEAEAINTEHHRALGNEVDAGTGNDHHQEPNLHG